ncbi:MAG: transcription antitermination factor NusB, partial [Ilumatobacteraceae bacterium]
MPDHIGDDPRTAAREQAISILYEAESRGIPVSQVVAGLVVPADPLTENLVLGFERDREVVDSIIERLSTNWTLDRMPAIDRAVLRLAVQELRTAPN